MTVSPISIKDRQLLASIQTTLSAEPNPLCPDFYQLLAQYGFADGHPLIGHFEHLLLDDTRELQRHFESSSSLTASEILVIFDHYLQCMARRVPAAIQDERQCRIALECLRRLSFYIMQEELIALTESTSLASRRPSRITDALFEHVMHQEQFLQSCNQLLRSENTREIAMLAIQFDFGVHSNNAVQHILPEIVNRLRQILREQDLITHISTRRWAICLRNVDNIALAILATNKIQRQFEALFHITDHMAMVKPYIGIALSHGMDNKDAEFLLEAALKASSMPSTHPDGYEIYDPDLDAETKRLDELSKQLKKALFDNALELYYQPKYSQKLGKIVGLEALLRWQTDDGLIPIPVIFTLIERDGLLNEFTKWLLQTAFRHLTDFVARGMDIKLSVNILPQNLSEPDFSSSLTNMLNIWKVPRDRLLIEITEGSMLDDADQTITALKQIRAMGLKISMDDFGTGYSSLSYLSRLPINEIKIDQAFVKNMFASERDEAIVKTIIELGNNFRLDLVAEGVEDERAARHLADIGCDILQGFWISKPVSRADLIAWFENDTGGIWQKIAQPHDLK
ncbi:putative signaling protein [Methylophilaceae bacterium]|nr:putative signaling protein [Methylophilaceae bacterium]